VECEWRRYAAWTSTPDGDPEVRTHWAGESCSVVNDVKPAGVIVRDLVREGEAALSEADGLAYHLSRAQTLSGGAVTWFAHCQVPPTFSGWSGPHGPDRLGRVWN